MDFKANKYICLQLACLLLYSRGEVCGDAGALLQTQTLISKTDISSHFFEDAVPLGANSLDLPKAKELDLPQAPFDVGSGSVPLPKNFHPVFTPAAPVVEPVAEGKDSLQVLRRLLQGTQPSTMLEKGSAEVFQGTNMPPREPLADIVSRASEDATVFDVTPATIAKAPQQEAQAVGTPAPVQKAPAEQTDVALPQQVAQAAAVQAPPIQPLMDELKAQPVKQVNEFELKQQEIERQRQELEAKNFASWSSLAELLKPTLAAPAAPSNLKPAPVVPAKPKAPQRANLFEDSILVAPKVQQQAPQVQNVKPDPPAQRVAAAVQPAQAAQPSPSAGANKDPTLDEIARRLAEDEQNILADQKERPAAGAAVSVPLQSQR